MSHDDDAVGYKRPPESGRFRPGKSGNPRGRPKGSADFKTDLAAEMRERITLHDKNGRAHKVTKQRALIKVLCASALQNEKNAVAALLACLRFFRTSNASSTESADIEDLDMIKDYVARSEARLNREPINAPKRKRRK
jgi:hypothetical protein